MAEAIGDMTIKIFAAHTASYNWSVMHQEWVSSVQAVFNKDKIPKQALENVTQKLDGGAG